MGQINGSGEAGDKFLHSLILPFVSLSFTPDRAEDWQKADREGEEKEDLGREEEGLVY